jgi:hypothetical protein
MRFDRTVVFALGLFLALAPVSRAGEIGAGPLEGAPTFVLPVSNLLAGQDLLRAQVIAQIQAVDTLSAAPAGLPAESAAIVRGLLANPAAVQAHAAELSKVLGPANFQSLTAVAAKSASVQSLVASGPAVNPADAGAVAQAGARIAQMFDGGSFKGEVAGSAVLGEQGQKDLPAEWRLHPNQQIHHDKPGAEAETMAMLARELKVMGLGPLKEKYVEEKVDAPLVAWAGLPSIWKLAIFREGGRQDPGNVLYVLDSSWFIQVPDKDGKNQVYVTKGLYFEKDGKTPVLVTYKHPRRDRYFGNWLTMGAFETAAGVPLEKNLNTPMSSSSRLEQVTNDKLWTRLLLSSLGARVPATRAFLLPDHAFIKRGGIPGSDRVKAGLLPTGRAEVRAAVVEFLAAFKGPEVVVKPSGPRFHSGEGVKFFPRGDVEAITDYVTTLSKHDHMDSQGVVLLEQRLAPPPVYFRLTDFKEGRPFVYQDRKKFGVEFLRPDEIGNALPHEKKDSNERVWVVRDSHNQPYTVPDTFFRAGTWGKPTSGQPKDPRDAASVVPFEIMREAWIRQHGVLISEAEVEEFMRERKDIGERALRAIMQNETLLERRDGDPHQAQTDMVGLDLMYQLEDGKLVPYVIEVNDHDAAGQHAADLFYPDREGAHSRVWVQTMRRRAAQDALNNP